MLQTQYSAGSEVVAQLTSELAAVNEELAQVKAQLDARGSGLADTSPLVNIKRAALALQEELKGFDVKIGVAQHALLQSMIRRS